MNALDQSLDGFEYADQLLKPCDPALIPVTEGGMASFDLGAIPAADSPQRRIIFPSYTQIRNSI
jgi:hypothetical protein